MNQINIAGRTVGQGKPAFIIAELSGNHHQKYEEAVELIKAAAEAGADAIKLQTYTPDTITINSKKKWFLVEGKDQPEDWKGQNLWDLYQTAHTPWEWQPKLKEVAEKLGLVFFSTPFDETAVDFLDTMQVPCFKISSYDAVNIPLIRKIASVGKPVIISIGFASLKEAKLAIDTLKKEGCENIVVLHCVTAYSDRPCWEETNLKVISDIKNRFGTLAGFSDNNNGIEMPVLAVAVGGAVVIEKHLILRRSDGGPDARFSIEPNDFKRMVSLMRKAEDKGADSVLAELGMSKQDVEKAMGNVHYGIISSKEEENKILRPSLWVKAHVKKGELFSKENIRVARPQDGLLPRYWDDVIGKIAACDIESATPVSWDLIERS